MKYITRITRYTIAPDGEPIFSETATHVEIEDEAAGEFVKITQEGGNIDNNKSILIMDEEWQAISSAVADLFAEIKKHENKKS